jgi:hypothetical protein
MCIGVDVMLGRDAIACVLVECRIYRGWELIAVEEKILGKVVEGLGSMRSAVVVVQVKTSPQR